MFVSFLPVIVLPTWPGLFRSFECITNTRHCSQAVFWSGWYRRLDGAWRFRWRRFEHLRQFFLNQNEPARPYHRFQECLSTGGVHSICHQLPFSLCRGLEMSRFLRSRALNRLTVGVIYIGLGRCPQFVLWHRSILLNHYCFALSLKLLIYKLIARLMCSERDIPPSVISFNTSHCFKEI